MKGVSIQKYPTHPENITNLEILVWLVCCLIQLPFWGVFLHFCTLYFSEKKLSELEGCWFQHFCAFGRIWKPLGFAVLGYDAWKKWTKKMTPKNRSLDLDIQIPPEVWCFRHVFGVHINRTSVSVALDEKQGMVKKMVMNLNPTGSKSLKKSPYSYPLSLTNPWLMK